MDDDFFADSASKSRDAIAPTTRHKRPAKLRPLVWTALAGAVVVVALIWLIVAADSSTIHVVLDKGYGLGIGAPVYVRGARVGSVSGIRFNSAGHVVATISVRRDAMDHLFAHSVFYATKENFLVGEACIAVYTPVDMTGPQLHAGSTVGGIGSIPATIARVVLPQTEGFVRETEKEIRRAVRK